MCNAKYNLFRINTQKFNREILREFKPIKKGTVNFFLIYRLFTDTLLESHNPLLNLTMHTSRIQHRLRIRWCIETLRKTAIYVAFLLTSFRKIRNLYKFFFFFFIFYSLSNYCQIIFINTHLLYNFFLASAVKFCVIW